MFNEFNHTLEYAKLAGVESSRFHSLVEAFERQIDMLKTLVKYGICMSVDMWNELIKKQEEVKQCLSL